MIRIHWSDPQPEVPGEIGWRLPAFTIATLFLNFPFWYYHGDDFRILHPLPLYGLIVAGAATILTILFFVGPSYACRAAGHGLMGALERSMGRLPAYGARFCCLWFLVCWMATLIALPIKMRLVVGGDMTGVQSGAVAVVLLAYLFATGVPSLRTVGRLAAFTTKLSLAVLIAAAIRVHEAWPAVFEPFPAAGRLAPLALWHGAAQLSLYVAPLAFLAADYVGPKQSRANIRMLAIMGLALPVGGGLFVLGMLNKATLASSYYKPSLNPNIAMALWGGVAPSWLPPLMMLTAMTFFGAVRFGARALATSMSVPWISQRTQRVLLACMIAPIAWLSIDPWSAGLQRSLELSVASLAVFAGVLSGDAVSGHSMDMRRELWIDWVGTCSAIAGLATAASVNGLASYAGWETWSHPWLLPSYAVAFIACVAGRRIQIVRHHRRTPVDGDVSQNS